MSSALPACSFCGQPFRPDPRVGTRQRSCPSPACRAQRKRDSQQNWLAANPDYFRGQYPKKRLWHLAHPGYLAEYRSKHPNAAEHHRESERARRSRRAHSRVDIQDEIARTQPLAGNPLNGGRTLPRRLGVDIQDEIPVRTLLFGLIQRLCHGRGRVDIPDEIDAAILDCYKAGLLVHPRRAAQ